MKPLTFLCLGSFSWLCLATPTVARQSQPRPVATEEYFGERHDDKKKLDDADTWTLKEVFREIPSDTRIWLGFHITSEGYDPEWCYMLVHVKEHAKEAPFANERCVGSNFTAAWGYRQEEDAGILTLFNPNKTRTAWFGWNHVNNATDLGDVGPNTTRKTEG